MTYFGKRKITGRWVIMEVEEIEPGWVGITATVKGEKRACFSNPFPLTASPGMKQAWDWRMEANLTGRCPSCENTTDYGYGPGNLPPQDVALAGMKDKGKLIHGGLIHEDYCPASDDMLTELCREWKKK